jgi:hypothetical protein
MKNFTAYNPLKSFNKGTNNPNNIELHNVENSPGGRAKHRYFRFILYILLTCVSSLANYSLAQVGSDCNNSLSLSIMEGSQIPQSAENFWLSYPVYSNSVEITYNPITTQHIDSIVIYIGNCSSLIRVIAFDVAGYNTMQIFNFNTSPGTHFIKSFKNTTACSNCFTPLIEYQLSVRIPVIPCDELCPGVASTCELICNSDFEFYQGTLNDQGQLPLACPWGNFGTQTTPDYFNSAYTTGGVNVDVPLNFFGNMNSANGGNAYAGIIAAGRTEAATSTVMYSEYLTGKLRFTLSPGVTYNFSTYINLACISEIKANNLGVKFSNVPLNQSTLGQSTGGTPGGNISGFMDITPDIILNVSSLTSSGSSTTQGNWTQFTGTFVATGVENYITFGYFGDGEVATDFAANTNCPDFTMGANAADWAYYFVDEFTLEPQNPASQIVLDICASTEVILTAPLNAVNIQWTNNIDPTWSATGNNIPVVPITNTIYTYTAFIYGTCQITGTVQVNLGVDCCIPDGTQSTILYSVENYTASDLINNFNSANNIISPIGTQNKLLISGTFVVDVDLIFDNGLDVIMGDDAKIYVNPGVKFTVTGASDIRACDKMWDGITLYGNALGAPSYFYLNDYSTVQDAKVAILTDDNFSLPLPPWGTFTIGGGIYYIEGNAILNKNHTNILVRDWDNFPGFIKNSEIKCRATSLTQPNDNLLEVILNTAWPTNRTYSGVQTVNVNTIEVGDATDGSNIFDNMDVGIFTLNTHSKIQNNEFKEFNEHPNYFPNFNQFCSCMVGTAICLRAKLATQGVKPFTTSIGGNGANEGNQLHEVNFGIDIEYHVAKIQHNSFNNIYYPNAPTLSYMGILINRVPKTFLPHYIENNNMRNVQDYFIFMRNNYNQKVIDNNLMNTNMPLSDLFWMNREATGITISENSNLTTLPQELFVRNNQINFVKNGVRCNNVNGMTIGENYISLLAANWDVENPSASYGTGIKAELCLHDTIHNNTIVAQDNRNWYVEGIWLMDTKDNRINCNAMSRTATGMRFEGFNTFHVSDPWNNDDNMIIRNRMHQNWHGLWVNNGLIGHQKTVDAFGNVKAHDNFWTGTYSWNYHTFWTVSGGTVPPAYAGNNSKLWTRDLNSMYCPSPFLANALPNLPPEIIWPNPTYNNVEATPNGYHVNQACTNIDNTDLNSDIPFPGWALQIAGGGNEPSPEGAAQYWQSTNYYKLLLENPALITDPTIQAFKDSIDTAPFGQLELVLKQLGDTNLNDSTAIQQIKQLNNGISESNALEQHFKTVNAMLIKLRELEFNDTIPIDSIHIAQIREIALLCPSIYGPAVYQARGLMEFLERKGYNYINDCEIQYPEDNANARTSNNGPYGAQSEPLPLEEIEELAGPQEALFSFYPNPASKQLFVNLPEDNKTKYFEIYNTTGAMVSYGNLNNVNGLNTLDIKQLADGLYLLKINGYKGQSFIVKQ